METNSNSPEAKQPASAGCHPTTCSRLFRWLRLPKFTYVNWHKEYPQAAGSCWNKWFSVTRYWSGKLIYIEFRHHSFQFDFRRDWLADFLRENAEHIRPDQTPQDNE